MPRTYTAILLSLLLAALSSSVCGQKITKEILVSEGKKRTYYLYLPPDLKPDPRIPLVVLLHGSNHVGLSLAEKWKDLAKDQHFIVVAPDSIDSAVWNIPDDGPGFIRDLVEAMISKYPVNPRRVYLFGHSGGAGFALLMAIYESQYFAAVAIHAGALNPDGIQLVRIATRKTPIHIQVGNRDSFFPLPVVRETRDAFKAEGFPIELVEIPNHDHWYYDLAPKINERAWEFLKVNELTDNPVFEEHNFHKQNPNAKNASEFASNYNRGLERLRAGDTQASIAAFSKALEIDGTNADAYNNRGVAYANQKKYEAAIADFSRSIQAKPGEAAYNNRGGIYFDMKKVDEAIADFSAAIKIKETAESYANRGLAYAQSGREELGLADYQRAIQLNPKIGRTYILRGLLFLKRSQAEEAQRDFDAGFKLDPKLHAEFDSLIEQVRTIRGIK